MKVVAFAFLAVATLFVLFWWKNEFALPIFCTTRGCVTSVDWTKEKIYQSSFATITNSVPPTETAILTTLVRKHLLFTIQNANEFADQAVTYRQDVLHLTEEDKIQQLGFTSFNEYDKAVTVPFLLQQSYMSEHNLKDPQQAYIQLSNHFSVFSLLFDYKWDSSKGEVVAR